MNENKKKNQNIFRSTQTMITMIDDDDVLFAEKNRKNIINEPT